MLHYGNCKLVSNIYDCCGGVVGGQDMLIKNVMMSLYLQSKLG